MCVCVCVCEMAGDGVGVGECVFVFAGTCLFITYVQSGMYHACIDVDVHM